MPNLGPEVRRSGWRLIRICMSLTAFTLAWLGASTSYLHLDSQREEPSAVSTVDAVVERIIDVESGGDPNAKNKRSSARFLPQKGVSLSAEGVFEKKFLVREKIPVSALAFSCSHKLVAEGSKEPSTSR
jgi:hypothetical protein